MAEDFGALFNSGTLKIRNSGNTVLVTFSLGATAFGSATDGKISANGLPITATAGADGTADNAILESSGGATYVLSGLTVDTTGSNVTIDNTSITDGQTVRLTQLDWTESAGIA